MKPKPQKPVSAAYVRRMKQVAQRIDREEAEQIKAEARIAFAHHEAVRSLVADLTAERRRQGLSLAQMADRTGIAKPNLSRLENDDAPTPRMATVERYARALGKAVRLELVDAA